MKRYRGFAFALLVGLILITFSGWGLMAQEKPKDIVTATKPVEVQFSPSDAIKIAKLRAVINEANGQIMAILKSYNIGDNGEFIEDSEHNWIGVRKVEVKPTEKKP